MNRKSVVAASSQLFIVGAISVFVLLIIGVVSISGKNTAGVGILTAITVRGFNDCLGNISFTSGKGDNITAVIAMSCASLVNTTGLQLPIDIRYNWRNPSSVNFDNVAYWCSGCVNPSHKAAMSVLIATIPLTVLCVAVAVVGFTYKRPRPARAAVAPEPGPSPV